MPGRNRFFPTDAVRAAVDARDPKVARQILDRVYAGEFTDEPPDEIAYAVEMILPRDIDFEAEEFERFFPVDPETGVGYGTVTATGRAGVFHWHVTGAALYRMLEQQKTLEPTAVRWRRERDGAVLYPRKKP